MLLPWAAALFGKIAEGLGRAFFGWLREKERDRQVAHDAVATDRLGQSEVSREKEHAIQDAVDKVRGEPGPAVPDLGRVRPADPRPRSDPPT